MRGGAYTRGSYTWSNTSVKEKVGLPAEGPICGGGLIGGEIRYEQSWNNKALMIDHRR